MGSNSYSKKEARVEEMVGCPGLDASSPFGGGGAARDIRNFKILPDGSLCRRDGYAVLASLGDEIRAVYAYKSGGVEYILAVVDNKLYRINTADGAVTNQVAFITHSGPADFFEYEGLIYILDGNDVYCYLDGSRVERVHGYVPLYGKDWSIDSGSNQVYEAPNLLTNRVRISYVGTGEPTILNPGIKLLNVVSAKLDGVSLNSSQCKISSDGQYIVCEDFVMDNSTLELTVTTDIAVWYDATLYTCTQAAAYRSFSGDRMFLFGGSDGAVVHSNLPVSDEAYKKSLWADAQATRLYFPKGSRMYVGHRDVVTAAVGIYDRMMFYTSGSSWLTESLAETLHLEASKIRLGSVSGIIGCRAPGAAGIIEGDVPVVVSSAGIYRWDIDLTLERGCLPQKISDGIAPLVGESFFTDAAMRYMRTTDELWISDPSDAEGRVMIYNCTGKCWYSYVGIGSKLFFEANDRIGFARGDSIYLFEPGKGYDSEPDGDQEITAIYEGRLWDFGNSEEQKKAVRLYLDGDTGGGDIEVSLSDDNLLFVTGFSAEEGLRQFSRRLYTPRFRRLALMIRATGPKPQHIWRVCIHAAP